MMEIVSIVEFFIAGLLLGGFFVGGISWTVRSGASDKEPELWFLGSSFIRIPIAFVAFYLISGGRWELAVICLCGIFIARIVLNLLVRVAIKHDEDSKKYSDAT